MIYEKSKEIRENANMTQKKIANLLNIGCSTYASWKIRIDSIPLLKLNDFCNYFNISLDYACGLTKIKQYEIINKDINRKIVSHILK